MSVSADVYEMIRASMTHTVPFARHVGVELTSLADGVASARLESTPDKLNHMGTFHAGALFTLAETAAGGAVAGCLAPFLLKLKAFPTAMDINFFAPCSTVAMAKSTVVGTMVDIRAALKAEQRVSFGVEVELTDDSKARVASISSTWVANLR